MLDVNIPIADRPGQMEAILGELKQLRESNALLKKRQTEIEAELSLAARVQQSLAPRSLVWNGVSVETHYSPAYAIGGGHRHRLPTQRRSSNRLDRRRIGTRHLFGAGGQSHLFGNTTSTPIRVYAVQIAAATS
jgi:serine phosphatase RsbU (regulator of sigma subunit)